MNKLIVETKNAPMAIVAGILATWSKLAELIEEKATLPKGCELEWELLFQHVSRETGWSVEEGVDYWEAYGAVRMVFQARVGGITDKRHEVNIPLTEVEEISIFSDGTFYWHSENGKAKPEDDKKTVERLVKAVCKGKLPSGHHYRCNWIPTFGSSQE